MIKRTLIPLLMLSCSLASAAELTTIETRWLTAGLAVINYAKEDLKLPVDITVQPQAHAEDVPVALGYRDGRCKLVLSLRGNPQAEDILGSVPEARRALMIEAMFAHEIAHCWRYAQGAWHQSPAGFAQSGVQGGKQTPQSPKRSLQQLLPQSRQQSLQQAAQQSLQLSLQQTRREEGFADLVALAWTQQRHPEHYADVAAWMRQVRQPVTSRAGAVDSHATMAWLQLAQTGAAFNSQLPLFEQAGSVWRIGLARGNE